jgi:hypothetical protein
MRLLQIKDIEAEVRHPHIANPATITDAPVVDGQDPKEQSHIFPSWYGLRS